VAVGGLWVGLLTALAESAPTNEQTAGKAAATDAAPAIGTGRIITLPPAPTTSTSARPTSSSAPSNPAATNTAPRQTTPPDASAAAPSTLTTSSASGFAVLAPATVPPKVSECTQQLTYGNDGTAGPISCADGGVNVLAWNYYARVHSPVMGLGQDATPGQVLQTMCTDVDANPSNLSIPIEIDSYDLAAAYYGWSFGVDLPQMLLHEDCPSTTSPIQPPQ
jgi:hypothetical protein